MNTASFLYPKLHNAMWPGLVGKEAGTDHPPISLDRMLELTVKATTPNGDRFEGIDIILLPDHIDPDGSDRALRNFADRVRDNNLLVGSIAAPVWPGAGGGSAMGDEAARKRFVDAVRKACRVGKILREHGARQYGLIRIDSADSPVNWIQDPTANTKKIRNTFREAGSLASDYGERLAAEGEICWAAMHSWFDMVHLLEEVNMPDVLGFQADLAHTYLYLLGYNAENHALLKPGYTPDQFWKAYKNLTHVLAPLTFDFHVAQNDGTVHGTGAHDKTGRHCLPDDPNGKLDIVRAAGYWLRDASRRGIRHICWDGCMFPNSVLEEQATWNRILDVMVQVRNAHGWQA